MGLCFRRPYKRVLPVLPDPVSCAAFPGPNCPQEQLDMSLCFEHLVSGCVCICYISADVTLIPPRQLRAILLRSLPRSQRYFLVLHPLYISDSP